MHFKYRIVISKNYMTLDVGTFLKKSTQIDKLPRPFYLPFYIQKGRCKLYEIVDFHHINDGLDRKIHGRDGKFKFSDKNLISILFCFHILEQNVTIRKTLIIFSRSAFIN